MTHYEIGKKVSPWTRERWIEYRRAKGYPHPETPITNTERHRRYAATHKSHLREYARQHYHRAWGRSNRLLGLKAEKLAIEVILPKLDFTELCHLSPLNRFIPFDIAGTYRGQRVLVEVTTGRSKSSLKSMIRIADALHLQLFVLFVKPDFSTYMLRQVTPAMKSVHSHLRQMMQIVR